MIMLSVKATDKTSCHILMSCDSREWGVIMEEKERKPLSKEEDRRLPPCTYASEWAEHARSYREDEPCDDGRAGTVCGRREEEDPCPI
jgi:hypothetical protein